MPLAFVTFNTVKDLNTHWLYHTGLMYKCKKCNKPVYTLSTWKFHNYCQKPKLYQCNTCHKKFMYSSKMRQHRHTHITQKHFKCSHGDCSKTYKHPQDLEWHAVTVKAKFQQNPDLMNMLKTTAPKLLPEGTVDKTWRTGVHLRDSNALDRSWWHSNGWLSNMLVDIKDNP